MTDYLSEYYEQKLHVASLKRKLAEQIWEAWGLIPTAPETKIPVAKQTAFIDNHVAATREELDKAEAYASYLYNKYRLFYKLTVADNE